MKDRIAPCIYYVCANADCKKGRKDVTHSDTCQHCDKYRPRKGSKGTGENKVSKLRKNANKDFKSQLRDY